MRGGRVCRLGLIALGASALLAVPLVLFNPDLARTPLEWAELLVALTAAAAALGVLASIWTRRRTEPGPAARWWLLVGIGLAALAVGMLVAGLLGAVIVALAFGAFAWWWRCRVPASDAKPLQALLPALGACMALSAAVLASAPSVDRQVVFIGLDGADWPIVDELRQQGRLPTFERLIQAGARAGLETIQPVLSPQIWTSIATGTSPAVHGVKDFWATSRDVRVKRLWEVVDENDMTSGVMSYLVTWPPEKDKGFLVPGWLAQDSQTFPHELEFLKRLEQREKTREGYSPVEAARMGIAAFRHGVTLGTLNLALSYYLRRLLERSSPFDEAYGGRVLKLELTTDVFCHLLRRQSPELGIFYYSSIDALEHQFFQYYQPSYFPGVPEEDVAHYGDLIPRIYEASDAAVARILRAAHTQATIVIASDHGQQPATALGERWYVIRSGALLEALGLGDSLRATNVGRSAFLRAKPGHETELEPAVRRIESEVRTIQGAPVFQLERPASDEALLNVHPELAFGEDVEVRVADKTLPLDRLINDAPQVSGEHTNIAFFLMAGRGVAGGKTLSSGSVLDIAPTILHVLGLPIARELEGRVLVEAFEQPGAIAESIVYVDSYGIPERALDSEEPRDVDEQTLDTLRALGYIQ
jgi:predicted AlkP superfamily phosphohydrolase/phosphomutase